MHGTAAKFSRPAWAVSTKVQWPSGLSSDVQPLGVFHTLCFVTCLLMLASLDLTGSFFFQSPKVSDAYAGRAEARAAKAGPLLRKDRPAQETFSGERKLTGARATAAARTRGQSIWGKRHVAKAGKDSFVAPAAPKASSGLTLSAVTKVRAAHH